jgi:hypothetical protein
MESLDPVESTTQITLQGSDGCTFTLPLKYAEISNVIKDTCELSASRDGTFPIGHGQATREVLGKIVEYMQLREGQENPPVKPPIVTTLEDKIKDPKDFGFLMSMEDRDFVIRVLNVANYLHIPSLLPLLCARIASLFLPAAE